jgi:hypothetical protein
MNHNSSPMFLTGLTNHDSTSWNYKFSPFGDAQGKANDK